MPETEHEALTKLCGQLGIESGDLNSMVEELKRTEARDINQEGLDAQVDYVLDYVGKEELRLRLMQMKAKTDEPKGVKQVMLFDEWKEEVNEEMKKQWGITWHDASGDIEPLRNGYEQGDSPKEFATWWGDKYDLDPKEPWG